MWIRRFFAPYMPDMVYGAHDGIITTFSVVAVGILQSWVTREAVWIGTTRVVAIGALAGMIAYGVGFALSRWMPLVGAV